jgi:hypothetical protein
MDPRPTLPHLAAIEPGQQTASPITTILLKHHNAFNPFVHSLKERSHDT